MKARAQLPVRVGGLVLAACAALAVAAPPALASASQTQAQAQARTATQAGTAAQAGIAGPSGVQAQGAAIANASTGALLWSRDLNTKRAIGSITKVMTALVVIRAGNLDRPITIPSAVVGYVAEWDASSADLVPGDRLTARQLLVGLLLPSGADAAYALAQAYGPGIPAFINKMNVTARQLGLNRTHFSNFDGLPWPTEYSTYS
ncbi:MAG: D-alanyl-D-alanine carboxypeptidase family protein, partial [Streptosporangiaceae bacterium]